MEWESDYMHSELILPKDGNSAYDWKQRNFEHQRTYLVADTEAIELDWFCGLISFC